MTAADPFSDPFYQRRHLGVFEKHLIDTGQVPQPTIGDLLSYWASAGKALREVAGDALPLHAVEAGSTSDVATVAKRRKKQRATA